jgi:hypothetical protein
MPVQMDKTYYCIFVLLEDDNLARIREFDPAEVNVTQVGAPWSELKLRDVVIAYLAPFDKEEFMRLCSMKTPREALRLVTRGFRFRPELGDHDNGPQKIS